MNSQVREASDVVLPMLQPRLHAEQNALLLMRPELDEVWVAAFGLASSKSLRKDGFTMEFN